MGVVDIDEAVHLRRGINPWNSLKFSFSVACASNRIVKSSLSYKEQLKRKSQFDVIPHCLVHCRGLSLERDR